MKKLTLIEETKIYKLIDSIFDDLENLQHDCFVISLQMDKEKWEDIENEILICKNMIEDMVVPTIVRIFDL